MSKVEKCLGVLTSGGDAPGMNAAVRAVVRSALHYKANVYLIREGYQGLVQGGESINHASWDSVSSILNKGGTSIGTARCPEFKKEEVQKKAVHNLLLHGIDRLIVIGGDGSLTGAQNLSENWPKLVKALVEEGKVSKDSIKKYPLLPVVGLIGSIDNDVYGSDLTIGTDTALHRILEAVDAINSTAYSHQRTFIVEVMGNRCGYLALMSTLITGADWVLIPERPPQATSEYPTWADRMCGEIQKGRKAGRRATIIIMAEGATDCEGNKITSTGLKQILEEKMGEEVRVTILGHVQRGGSPSAFDRNMSTILGHAAAEKILCDPPHPKPLIVGVRGNNIEYIEIEESLRKTYAVADAIAVRDYDKAMKSRGTYVNDIYHITQTLIKSSPTPPESGMERFNLAVIHGGTQAPGMNTATRVAVRLAIEKGHNVLSIRNGFDGFIKGNSLAQTNKDNKNIIPMDWMKVNRWASKGGAELGTNRIIPESDDDFKKIAKNIEEFEIKGLLVIGGWQGYLAAYKIFQLQNKYPQFKIPIVCIPATISNRLPGTEVSIGSDTALNNIVEAVDKIKQSAVGLSRCFITEVTGRYCGYLALMSAMATGAERVYMHEDRITLARIQNDLNDLVHEFKDGRRIALVIRNENAHKAYTTDFMTTLFDEESCGYFDAKHSILGHLQHGGSPSPFDRIVASRLACGGIDFLVRQLGSPSPFSAFLGLIGGKIVENNLHTFPAMVDEAFERPKNQWWEDYRTIIDVLSRKP